LELDVIINNKYKEYIQEGYNIVIFQGNNNEKNVEYVLNEIDSKLHLFDKKIRRKIFFVCVEFLQNIYHHASKQYTNFFFVFNVIGKHIIKISAGNYTDKSKFEQVKSKIEQLNLLNYDEMLKLYRMVLNNNEFSEKGGGGLGFIDVSRKTDLPIDLNYVKLNENLYFLIFSVFLKNKI